MLGTFGCVALEPEKIPLKVPKWVVPRKWTYPGGITVSGVSASIHSVRAPGGFQMIGRTPIDIYDPQQKNPIFRDDPILAKPTDRIEFYSIKEMEYHQIRSAVEAGEYHYEIEEGVYRIKDYRGIQIEEGEKSV
jgi:allophanate hydrolase subunit 1